MGRWPEVGSGVLSTACLLAETKQRAHDVTTVGRRFAQGIIGFGSRVYTSAAELVDRKMHLAGLASAASVFCLVLVRGRGARRRRGQLASCSRYHPDKDALSGIFIYSMSNRPKASSHQPVGSKLGQGAWHLERSPVPTLAAFLSRRPAKFPTPPFHFVPGRHSLPSSATSFGSSQFGGPARRSFTTS